MRNVVINYLVGTVLSGLLMLAMSQVFFGSVRVLFNGLGEIPPGSGIIMVVCVSTFAALLVHMVREFWSVWTKQ